MLQELNAILWGDGLLLLLLGILKDEPKPEVAAEKPKRTAKPKNKGEG